MHLLAAAGNREPWLGDTIRPQAFGYLASLGRDMGCRVHRVGGTCDHVHLAVDLTRTLTVANLVKNLKSLSSTWIKQEGSHHAGFAWQSGYGAFSLGATQLPTLVRYIDNQLEHHRKRGFQEEYRDFLAKYKVDFDERYVWD